MNTLDPLDLVILPLDLVPLDLPLDLRALDIDPRDLAVLDFPAVGVS